MPLMCPEMYAVLNVLWAVQHHFKKGVWRKNNASGHSLIAQGNIFVVLKILCWCSIYVRIL